MELMISISICAAMMALAWGTSAGSVRMRKKGEEIQVRHHEIRIALAKIVQDLSSAYLSGNEDMTAADRRTLMVAKESDEVDELRFTSFAHTNMWADSNESEQTLISYHAERDKEDSSVTHLIRRESRRLSNEQWENEPAEYDVLLHDVHGLHFEYWDWRNNNWRKEWNTTQSDGQSGKLPMRVKIKLELKNEKGDVVPFYSTARIMMQEQLLF